MFRRDVAQLPLGDQTPLLLEVAITPLELQPRLRGSMNGLVSILQLAPVTPGASSCPASAHGKWWARRSSRPPGATCRFCKGFWKASRGGTRLLQITGWRKDKATCLQLVMDEPPEQLYNQWIRDRMEFYKRVEPTEPPRDERLVLGDASTPRMRFSSSNGLGDVSTALWSVILSNPEKSGLAAIHSVAKEAILKLPFWRWRSIFTPHRDLGASGPVLGGGRCWGVSLFAFLCSLRSPPCFNTPRLPVASNRRLHNLAAPRTGRIGHCLKKVAAAEPGFPEVIWGFSGNPPSGWSSPLPWFLLGISGGV